MPNWCNNGITITGPKDKLKDLLQKAEAADQDQEECFLSLLCPRSINDSADRCTYDIWGTSGIIDLQLSFSETDDGAAQIVGYFDSAWEPPLAAYEHFVKNNPDCSIDANYCELGCDFMGTWKDGHDNCLSVYEVMSEGPKKWSATEKRMILNFGLLEQFEEEEEFEWMDDYDEVQLERELEAA